MARVCLKADATELIDGHDVELLVMQPDIGLDRHVAAGGLSQVA
jgi:hypothetical protein